MTEAGTPGTAGPSRTTGPEGTEGRTQTLEVAPSAATRAAVPMTVSVLMTVATHRNHSIPSLIYCDASTIYRNRSHDKALP